MEASDEVAVGIQPHVLLGVSQDGDGEVASLPDVLVKGATEVSQLSCLQEETVYVGVATALFYEEMLQFSE